MFLLYFVLLGFASSLVGCDNVCPILIHNPLERALHRMETGYRSSISTWRKEPLFQDLGAGSKALTCLASHTSNESLWMRPALDFLHTSVYSSEQLTTTLHAVEAGFRRVSKALAPATIQLTALHRENHEVFAAAEDFLTQAYMQKHVQAVEKATLSHPIFRIMHWLYNLPSIVRPSPFTRSTSNNDPTSGPCSPPDDAPNVASILRQLIEKLSSNAKAHSRTLEPLLDELESAYHDILQDLWTLFFATDFHWRRVYLSRLPCLWYTGSTVCTPLSLEERYKGSEWEGMRAVLRGLQDARAQLLDDLMVLGRLRASLSYAGKYLAKMKVLQSVMGGEPGRRLGRVAAALGTIMLVECVEELPSHSPPSSVWETF